MKVAIYAIAKNEEEHAARFMRAIGGEADLVLVADTGSTDRTREVLREHGAQVHELEVRPWRFDVARNRALDLVPADVDVVLSLDLDEVLAPGWRAAIERAWSPGVNRLRYPYVWSHETDGRPGVSYHADKVHGRHTHRWRCPVHETLAPVAGVEERSAAADLRIDHWPDETKSRSSYLPLLELAACEEPGDDRTSHYLGRELMFVGRWADAIRELERHLALPSARWAPERAASMRFVARCLFRLGRPVDARGWLLRAAAEAPGEREPWVELARALHAERDFDGSTWAARRALAIRERPPTYVCEPEAWGALPDDLAAVGCWETGRRLEAIEHGLRAAALDPADARLRGNVELMERLAGPASEPPATTNPTPKEGHA